MSQPAPEPANQGAAEIKKLVREGAHIHQVGSENEKRNGQEDVGAIKTGQHLLERDGHVLTLQKQVEHGRRKHRVPDGQADDGGYDDEGDGDAEFPAHSEKSLRPRSSTVDSPVSRPLADPQKIHA